MRPTATNDPIACVSVSQSAYQSVTRLRCAKTAKRIKMLFGKQTREDTRHIMLDGGPDHVITFFTRFRSVRHTRMA